MSELYSLEICAGAGGQALGLERAGFRHTALVEIDSAACSTLSANRPNWDVQQKDVRALDGTAFRGIDLIAGGVPCPPFSVAGKQLGADDDRDLFPTALRLIAQAQPAAVMLENVPGFASARFEDYRRKLDLTLRRHGYVVAWQVLNACNFGVPQLRPRFVLVALKPKFALRFAWPSERPTPKSVGATLVDLMAKRNWPGAIPWSKRANGIAPTLVGGSKLHGGPDLGPTRAKQAWRELGVDAHGVADEPPDHTFPADGLPKLTVRMAARLQGFPDDWQIVGRKTAAYRQVGNAFPPPVAEAVGSCVYSALLGAAAERADSQMIRFG